MVWQNTLRRYVRQNGMGHWQAQKCSPGHESFAGFRSLSDCPHASDGEFGMCPVAPVVPFQPVDNVSMTLFLPISL